MIDAKYVATYKLRSWGKESRCPTHYAKEFFVTDAEMQAWVDKISARPESDPMAMYYTVVELVTLETVHSNY